MDRNKKRLIVVAIVIVIIVLVVMVKINKDKKAEQERIARTIVVNETEDVEINLIKQKLERNGLKVEIEENIYSESLGETGKIFNIDGIEVEVYHINEAKILNLSQGKSGDVVIKGFNGINEDALIFGETVILKCNNEKVKEKLKDALSDLEDENTELIKVTDEE